MNKGKILLIMPEYTLGGAEAQLRYIIYALNEKKIPTDVLILGDLKEDQDDLLEKDRKKLCNIGFHKLSLYRASEYRKRDCIRDYIHSSSGEKNYRVILFFNEIYIPLIPFFKELGIATIYSERLEGEKACADELYRYSLKKCDVLTANSVLAAEKMKKTFGKNVIVVPNGKEIKKEFDYQHKNHIENILVPCRIDPIKNLGVVIDMAIVHKDRKFFIQFVGKKHYEAYAEKLEEEINKNRIDDCVSFVGYVDDMASMYQWADVVVLPSLAEGTPNVVLEAFMYGRPVIVSDIEAERVIVRNENFRFDPSDSESLYRSIVYLESMKDDAISEMIKTNREFVKREFDLKRMTDAFISILLEAREAVYKPVYAEGYELCKKELKRTVSELEKKERFYALLCEWNSRLHKGNNITDYLRKNGYLKIAIYGYKELGKLLYTELKEENIDVCCIIDRDAKRIFENNVSVIDSWDLISEELDAVIVTAVTSFEEIKAGRPEWMACPVISLEEIVFEGKS